MKNELNFLFTYTDFILYNIKYHQIFINKFFFNFSTYSIIYNQNKVF